jgi:hypothetical protein
MNCRRRQERDGVVSANEHIRKASDMSQAQPDRPWTSFLQPAKASNFAGLPPIGLGESRWLWPCPQIQCVCAMQRRVAKPADSHNMVRGLSKPHRTIKLRYSRAREIKGRKHKMNQRSWRNSPVVSPADTSESDRSS